MTDYELVEQTHYLHREVLEFFQPSVESFQAYRPYLYFLHKKTPGRALKVFLEIQDDSSLYSCFFT